MAKNVEKFIAEAINELQKENHIAWELIIIDDHSMDKTFEIVKKIAVYDNRIILRKNPYIGKVDGTSYAYSITSGDIIKCIDSDDILLQSWFDYIDQMGNYDAHCHSAFIVDEKLKKITKYNVNNKILQCDFKKYVENLYSIPKWSWSFNRDIGNKIFPLPKGLPFEDVWIGLLIKKHANNILNIPIPLYLYRQHSGQTFGGIINYDKDVVIFRANRILKLIEVLKKNEIIFNGEGIDMHILKKPYESNALLSKGKLKFSDLLRANIGIFTKIKIYIIRFQPSFAGFITKMKWFIDGKK